MKVIQVPSILKLIDLSIDVTRQFLNDANNKELTFFKLLTMKFLYQYFASYIKIQNYILRNKKIINKQKTQNNTKHNY